MRKLVSILLALAVFLPSTAFADDSPMGGQGETVYPVKNTEIVMEKEEIDIRLSGTKAYYTCRFYFKNTGENTRCLVGFPNWSKSYQKYEGEFITDYRDAALYNFKTYVDGRRVPVALKYNVKDEALKDTYGYYPVWYTWNVPFKKGQVRQVKNTYRTKNEGGYISYILNTGANWKDKIGKVTVRIHTGDIDPTLLYYDSNYTYLPQYLTEDGTLVWEMEALEPDRDINVSIWDFNFDAYDEAWGKDGFWEPEKEAEAAAEDGGEENMPYASAPEVFDKKSYKSLIRLENHYKQKHYRSVIWWGKRIRRLFKGEQQPKLLNYYMGVAYYKRKLYKDALKELEQCGTIGLYYKALCLKKLGKTAKYRECLTEMSAKSEYFGFSLWAKSRLKDMGV